MESNIDMFDLVDESYAVDMYIWADRNMSQQILRQTMRPALRSPYF